MSVESPADVAVSFDDARSAAYRVGVAHASDATITIPVDGPPDPVLYVLARRASAAGRVPSADVAAMDGFAVAGPPPWEMTGSSLAGDDLPASRLEPGSARLIATGAVVPPGADGVIRHEDVAGDWPPTEDVIRPVGAPRPGHVRRAGEELEPGAVIGHPGEPVHAAMRGLAAASGLDVLGVRRPPRVALIATGTELTSSGPAAPGRVRDAITPIMRQLMPGAGAEVVAARTVPDDAAMLRERLGEAAGAADVVITSGMASNGPTDHVRAVLAELGAEPAVPRVRVRPGGPQSLALLPLSGRTVPVVSLPGNPLAAVVGFHTLCLPLIRGLLGAPEPALAAAELDDAPARRAGDWLVTPVEIAESGRLRVTGWGGSAQLRGLARQGLLAVLAPDGVAAPDGASSVRLLRTG